MIGVTVRWDPLLPSLPSELDPQQPLWPLDLLGKVERALV